MITTLTWAVGFAIAGAIVIVVAALLLLLLRLTSQIERQARDIVAALEQARDNTQGLWAVEDTNLVASQILSAAKGDGA